MKKPRAEWLAGRNLHVVLSSVALAAVISAIAVVGFYPGKVFTYLLVLAGLILIAPVSVMLYFVHLRKKKISEEFPLLLRDIAEARRAGMPLIAAIKASASEDYGYLNDEIRRINNQLMLGKTVTQALESFSKRINDKAISQIVQIVREANEAGGDISEIFLSIARMARTIGELEKEVQSRFRGYLVTNYIIFIIFLVVLGTLQKFLMPLVVTSEFLSPAQIPPNLFLHIALIQAFFTGLITGRLSESNYKAGLMHSFILMSMAAAAFAWFTFG
ncbi:MAG: type II secretion system F family protein [archaeon]